MKILILLGLVVAFPVFAQAESIDAPQVAQTLKKTLMENLQRELKEKGAVGAVDFCHLEVKKITSKALEKAQDSYGFGRASLKNRNPENGAPAWMKDYLLAFQDKKQNQDGAEAFYHTLENGQRVYLDPLWVTPVCLQCHGEFLNEEVKKTLSSKYPEDKATGYRVGDFRGFVWVKEK